MKESKTNQRTYIKVACVALIAINIIALFIPFISLTTTIKIFGMTETVTIKSSFMNILLNSTLNPTSSLGSSSLDAVVIGDFWDVAREFNKIRVLIGIALAFFVLSIVVLILGIAFDFTNKNHTRFFEVGCIVFYLISVMALFVSEQNFANYNYSLGFSIKLFVGLFSVNGILSWFAEHYIEKERVNAIESFFEKYSKQTEKFNEDLTYNFFNCLNDAGYISSLDCFTELATRKVDILRHSLLKTPSNPETNNKNND